MSSGNTTAQLCTFFLDGVLFGVDVAQVQEVIRAQPMTPVPLAPAAVRGLINLRGQIVTAIDMRTQLGVEAAEQAPTNVVVRSGESITSLLVDEIGDVVEVESGLFEPPPQTLPRRTRALIKGVYKLDPRLLLLLDIERAAVSSDGPGNERDEQ